MAREKTLAELLGRSAVIEFYGKADAVADRIERATAEVRGKRRKLVRKMSRKAR